MHPYPRIPLSIRAVLVLCASVSLCAVSGSPPDRSAAAELLDRAGKQRGEEDAVTALDTALRAIAAFERKGDTAGTARACLLAGDIEAERHRPAEALPLLLRAASLAEAAGDAKTLRRAVELVGLQALLTGRLGLAVSSLERALGLVVASGETRVTGAAHGLYGVALQTVGQFDAALEQYEAAAAFYREVGMPQGEIAALLNVGTIEAGWLGRSDDAVRTFEIALHGIRTHRDIPRWVEGSCLVNLADALVDGGRPDDALARLAEAVVVIERSGHLPTLASLWAARAKAHLHRSDWSAARDAAERAGELAAKLGDLRTLRTARGRRGHALEAAGDLEGARRDYEAAVEALERLRQEVQLEEMQVSFSRDKLDSYESLIALLWRLHREDPAAGWEREALAASERSRARSFLDHLPAPPGASRPQDPLDAREIQGLLHESDLLLEYFFGRERVYLFAVRREGMTFSELGPTTELAERVAFLAGSLRAAQPSDLADERGASWRTTAMRLEKELLDPGRALHPEATTLVIVPDGPLFALPFEALAFASSTSRSRGPSVSYVPSATVLAALRDRARDRAESNCDLLAVAVSEGMPAAGDVPTERIPLAIREARDVARYFDPATRRILESGATEPVVREALTHACRVVHFATHARLNPSDPGASSLLLEVPAPGQGDGEESDGLLSVREIAQLELPADLVVLSGCGTASGEFAPGEGVLGLGRAFLRAGPRALLATLWDISDAAAAEMIALFFEEAAKGASIDLALARARARSTSGIEGQAFIVVGDGRLRLGSLRVERPGTAWLWGAGLVAAGVTIGAIAATLALRTRHRAARGEPLHSSMTNSTGPAASH